VIRWHAEHGTGYGVMKRRHEAQTPDERETLCPAQDYNAVGGGRVEGTLDQRRAEPDCCA